jgi:hypothetical protein
MGAPLDVSIDRIKQSSSRLNKTADEAATVVSATENFLNTECSIGIIAYVTVSREDISGDGGPYETISLGYQTWGERYRIVVSHDCDDREHPDVKPWAECGREMKLNTIHKLPELIEEIANRIDAKIGEAHEAVTTVASMLKTLERKGVK